MTPQERFVEEHALVTMEDVELFDRMTRIYVVRATHECNGDPHPNAKNPNDKNECVNLWEEDSRKQAEKMERLAKSWGFHHLDFGVGFYPTLQTTESQSDGTVHFPYYEEKVPKAVKIFDERDDK